MSDTANSELSEKHYDTMRSLGKPGVCFASSAGSTAAGRASAVIDIPSWRIATRNMRARQACGDFFEDQPVVDVLVRTIAAHTPSAIYNHDLIDANGMGPHDDERARHANISHWLTFRPGAGSIAFVVGNLDNESDVHTCARV